MLFASAYPSWRHDENIVKWQVEAGSFIAEALKDNCSVKNMHTDDGSISIFKQQVLILIHLNISNFGIWSTWHEIFKNNGEMASFLPKLKFYIVLFYLIVGFGNYRSSW
jgi:hypothetical protein